MRAQLPAALKLQLMVLLDHYNDRSGRCDPGQELIAALCGGVEKRTVRRHTTQLERLGLLTAHRRQGRSNRYTLHLDTIAALPPAPEALRDPHDDAHDDALQHAAPELETPELVAAPEQAPQADDLVQPPQTPPAPQKAAQAEEPAVAIAPDTLAAVNAQRVANGKAAFRRAELHDLHREATLAGITPQAAAEWILARPGRNFFRADFASAASLTGAAAAQARPAAPVELTAAGRAAMALRARYEAGIVLPPSAAPIERPARPAALQTVTLRSGTATAVGGSTGTGWARKAIDRFLAGETVNRATLGHAAAALGLTLADLKAQRAAAMEVAA